MAAREDLTSHHPSCAAPAEHVLWGWALFAALTWLHVYANIRAMRCLVLTSLNEPRLELLLEAYMEKVGGEGL